MQNIFKFYILYYNGIKNLKIFKGKWFGRTVSWRRNPLWSQSTSANATKLRFGKKMTSIRIHVHLDRVYISEVCKWELIYDRLLRFQFVTKLVTNLSHYWISKYPMERSRYNVYKKNESSVCLEHANTCVPRAVTKCTNKLVKKCANVSRAPI